MCVWGRYVLSTWSWDGVIENAKRNETELITRLEDEAYVSKYVKENIAHNAAGTEY